MAGGKKFILGVCAGLITASLGVLWSLQGASLTGGRGCESPKK